MGDACRCTCAVPALYIQNINNIIIIYQVIFYAYLPHIIESLELNTDLRWMTIRERVTCGQALPRSTEKVKYFCTFKNESWL